MCEIHFGKSWLCDCDCVMCDIRMHARTHARTHGEFCDYLVFRYRGTQSKESYYICRHSTQEPDGMNKNAGFLGDLYQKVKRENLMNNGKKKSYKIFVRT